MSNCLLLSAIDDNRASGFSRLNVRSVTPPVSQRALTNAPAAPSSELPFTFIPAISIARQWDFYCQPIAFLLPANMICMISSGPFLLSANVISIAS